MKTHISKSIFATLCFALVAAAGYFSYQQNQEKLLAQEQELVLEDESVEALTACEASVSALFVSVSITCINEEGTCGVKLDGDVILECTGRLSSSSVPRSVKDRVTIY